MIAMDIEELEREALKLSEAEKALLADRSLESISKTPETWRKAWIKEAVSRLKPFENGYINAVDGKTALAGS